MRGADGLSLHTDLVNAGPRRHGPLTPLVVLSGGDREVHSHGGRINQNVALKLRAKQLALPTKARLRSAFQEPAGLSNVSRCARMKRRPRAEVVDCGARIAQLLSVPLRAGRPESELSIQRLPAGLEIHYGPYTGPPQQNLLVLGVVLMVGLVVGGTMYLVAQLP